MKMTLAAVILVVLCISGATCVEVCKLYPTPDPCLPGGVWDPVLQSCTGYNGHPCYQCYSGSLCKDIEDVITCELKAEAGNPLYLSEFWLNSTSVGDPCTSTLSHYRQAYQFTTIDSDAFTSPLVQAIQTLHVKTGNAEVEDYHIVAGMGATMVLNLAVAALSKRILNKCQELCPDKVDVFAQTPYYPGYPSLMDIPTARWNSTANPSSPWTIEIVTYPNNPNGAKRSPLVQDPERVIMDMVYYWPMYTDVDQKLDKPLMIFSSSKHGGFAGSRFGWALVKDAELASSMWNIASSMILSLSVDIELRILTAMQAVLSQGQSDNGLFPLHEFGRDIIYGRFNSLKEALLGCPDLELQNSLTSPGGYAWIHCKGQSSCADIFTKVNLFGSPGSHYGTTDNDIRFTMLLPTVEFNILQEKVKKLCS